MHITRGTQSIGDIPIYLQQGGRIILKVDFKVEMLPVGLLGDHDSYYFRLRAFDADGNLAAANITAVPDQHDGIQTASWDFVLVGFDEFTTPMNWKGTPTSSSFFQEVFRHGYWEPTAIKALWDGRGANIQEGYGIPPGTYTITIEEELTEGRYIQLEEIEVVVTCSGEVTRVLEVDQAPLIAGSVYTRNFMNDFRNASWLPAGISGSPDVGTYSYDGVYWSYYPIPGSQMVSVGLSGDLGYVGQSAEVATTWGAQAIGNSFYLEESGIPIPEFPVAIFALISALGASLLLIRWRRETTLSVR